MIAEVDTEAKEQIYKSWLKFVQVQLLLLSEVFLINKVKPQCKRLVDNNQLRCCCQPVMVHTTRNLLV
jgi:hypothetical protein